MALEEIIDPIVYGIPSGRAKRAIFFMRASCLTVSKALLKSSPNTLTYDDDDDDVNDDGGRVPVLSSVGLVTVKRVVHVTLKANTSVTGHVVHS